jgi:hypothetical protein
MGMRRGWGWIGVREIEDIVSRTMRSLSVTGFESVRAAFRARRRVGCGWTLLTYQGLFDSMGGFERWCYPAL